MSASTSAAPLGNGLTLPVGNGHGKLNGSSPVKKPLADSDSDLSEEEDSAPLAKRPRTYGKVNGNGNGNGNGLAVKPPPSDDGSSDDDDAPLAKSNGVKKEAPSDDGDDSDDSDAPLTSVVASAPPSTMAGSDDEGDDSDAPLTASVRGKRSSGSDDDDDDDDEDDEEEEEEDDDDGDDADTDAGSAMGKVAKAAKKVKSKIKAKLQKKGGSRKTHEAGNGEQKWTTLVHNGPRFAEPYTPLPKDVTLKYDGQPVVLPPESEEVAMFYAVKLETQHAKNPIFNKNFFDDFKGYLKKYPPRNGLKIQSFDKLDFRDMYNHWRGIKDAEAAAKKAKAPSQRKRELEERKAQEKEWRTCWVDGAEQSIGNFNIEPPGLFLGRGAHPKAGKVKRRTMPEDVTINHSANQPAPKPPFGKWGEVVEKKDVTWLAFWKEPLNGNYKYVFLDAASEWKASSDKTKFQKARKLDECVVQIRRDVDRNLKSKSRQERQIATIVWLIDNFSLRAGNEKGEDEAETYGVCSLRCEHARMKPPHTLHLEFLGKDSMKFEEDLTITNPDVYKNLCMFLQTSGQKDRKGQFVRKKPSDPIFCAPYEVDTVPAKLQPIAPDSVNRFLSQYMPGLSAKVFRTYNASTTFQGLLDQTEEWLRSRPKPQEREINVNNLKIAYNEANRQVAILCNHQRTVNPVAMGKIVERAHDKMFALRYDIHKEQQKLLTFHTKAEVKKDLGAKQAEKVLAALNLDPERIRQHEESLIQAKKLRLQSAYTKQQAELDWQLSQQGFKDEGEGEGSSGSNGAAAKPKPKAKSKKALEAEAAIKASIRNFKEKSQFDAEEKELDKMLKDLEKERKTNKSLAPSANIGSCARKIASKYEAIKKAEAELTDKTNMSDVSLTTSKMNYIDPRITSAWLKYWDERLIDLGVATPPAAKKRAAVKKEEEDDDDDKGKARGKGKGKATKATATKGKKDAKPAKGAAKGRKVKKEEEEEDDDDDAAAIADSDRLDLRLKVLSVSQYFPTTLQKKFRWASVGDDGRPITKKWTFVPNARSKMRQLASADRKGDQPSTGSMAAMTDENPAGAGQPDPTSTKNKVTAGRGQKRKEPPTGAATAAAPAKRGRAKKPAIKAESEDEDDDDSDDDMPLAASKS
ncbi:uncharacterized protein PFL1_03209 [Pseudozyma flocculosa PF-1]|uniref:DNA topoisomerase I n=2 Tax=Pseudozyma flocculosa TaxID=84751 RepID=A0A5C3F1P1_9BASI|nr:uncharacterized protein PFL1_03209 [Pseudozyma flocculosa PF-1]EPQ29454.1 hypothetical protein PFL1_03209 [Pseudozyma flocculosa PF-1]SPO37980.1 related to DNA topoisomerase 1 [Pseudozyma flocculosa]